MEHAGANRCGVCGHACTPGARFCLRCGARLPSVPAPSADPADPVPPAREGEGAPG